MLGSRTYADESDFFNMVFVAWRLLAGVLLGHGVDGWKEVGRGLVDVIVVDLMSSTEASSSRSEEFKRFAGKTRCSFNKHLSIYTRRLITFFGFRR